MKRNSFTAFAVLILALVLANAVQPVSASKWAQEIKAALVPTTISYQGLVKVDGQPFTSTGYFKFAIVSADGSTSHWSNDGTSVGGSAPTNPVPLPVNEGLFSVLLGDTTLSGMTRIIDAQTMWLAGKNCRLRVWFSPDGVAAYTLLSPDRAFASAPFALVAENAVDSDLLDGHSSAYFQRRVSGACAAGSTVQSVAADGTVTCLPLYPNLGTAGSPFYDDAVTGKYISMAIGADGLPLLAYYNDTSDDLFVAHCNDLACGQATITRLDSAGDVGSHASIAISDLGFGMISYHDATNGNLKLAMCTNLDCTEANLLTLDTTDDVGEYTSISVGAYGSPAISYIDQTNDDLMLAICNNSECSGYGLVLLDSGLITGSTSITKNTSNLMMISYYDDASDDLKVLTCLDESCSTKEIQTVDSSGVVGQYSSITIGLDGLAIISYYDATNDALKVAHCSTPTCSSSTKYVIDSLPDSGKYTSIIIGSDGLPIIAYEQVALSNARLKIAHCSTMLCDSSITMDIGYIENTGVFTSIAVGMDGLPIIAYYDAYSTDAAVTHCANPLCILYKRGR